MSSKKKICFVIAPIGESDSETRKRSDQVLKHVIRPAVHECGYEAVRADEIDKPGIITSQVIQHVVDDPLVVADLTERNPNVFYELAVRHALRRPLVQLIRKGDAIPFDVAGTRTIAVDHRDLDSVDQAKKEIVAQIRSLEANPADLETPISVSLDLQVLRHSEKPQERSLADLLAAVSELRTSLGKLEVRVGTQGQAGILDEINEGVRALPRQMDSYFDALRGPLGGRGRRALEFSQLRMLAHLAPPSLRGFGILIVSSLFRDWMPWLCELGMEIYRALQRGDMAEVQALSRAFRQAFELSVSSGALRGRHKDFDSVVTELESLVEWALLEVGPRRSGGARSRQREPATD